MSEESTRFPRRQVRPILQGRGAEQQVLRPFFQRPAGIRNAGMRKTPGLRNGASVQVMVRGANENTVTVPQTKACAAARAEDMPQGCRQMPDRLPTTLRYRKDEPETPARRLPVSPCGARCAPRNCVCVYMGLYSAIVVSLILAYHIVMYLVVSVLASSLALSLPSVGLQACGPGEILILAMVCLFLARLVCHICSSTLALIRDVHDPAGEFAKAVPLPRAGHTEIYALVSDVARRIAAPFPDEIRVAPRAVSHVSELRSLTDRQNRRLVLVLGLPQIAVFSVQELQVLLAHELAHFSCGDTRLRVFVCRFVDTLEDNIQAWKSNLWHRGDPLFWFSIAFVRLFRIVAAPFHRQQELRADCISAAAYGGALAQHTLLKDWALGVCFDEFLEASEKQAGLAREDLVRQFDEFIANWRDLSPAANEYLADRLIAEEPMTYWDSHPSVQRRLAAMQSFGQREVPDHRPVRNLLPEFRRLVEELVDHFREDDRRGDHGR
jgi:Zn-dependent protease with chaperone function